MTTDTYVSDIQAVIFAAGKGSRMTQLLFGKPKCLLPIGNKPMIQYSLELLIRSRIKKTIIIVLDNEEESIKSTIHQLPLDISITYVAISSLHDCATADSLRMIKDKIKRKDVLVLSCDLVTDIDLAAFIEQYRVKNPTFSCVLSAIPSEKENQAPARKLQSNKEFDIVGLDAAETDRLVFFEPDVMFGDSVPVKRRILEQCSNFRMRTDLHDAHIYLLKNWILNYLEHEEYSIKSLKADLAPSLVRKQFRERAPRKGGRNCDRDLDQSNDDHQEDQNKIDESKTHVPQQQQNQKHQNVQQLQQQQQSQQKKIFDFIQVPKLYQILDQLNDQNDLDWIKDTSATTSWSSSVGKSFPESSITCYAHLVEPNVNEREHYYCVRVNNWVRFCEANRIVMSKQRGSSKHEPGSAAAVARSEAIRSYVDGIVGPGTQIGERCAIKRTIIGANCRIGDKVKLTNCIVLDAVTIDEGCVLQGSLVCCDVAIGSKAEIKDCLVGPGQKIVPLGCYTNESLTEEILDL